MNAMCNYSRGKAAVLKGRRAWSIQAAGNLGRGPTVDPFRGTLMSLMETINLDIRSQTCPSCLLLTLKELNRNASAIRAGRTAVVVLTDDRQATASIPATAERMGFHAEVTRIDGGDGYRIRIFDPVVPTNLSREEALRYIRTKIDQLLTVMGTLPLRPAELDDETLIALDPLGIIAESFRQVIEHLNTTNERLALASAEIRSILDTLGAAVVVLNQDDRIEDCNQPALDWFFHGQEKSALAGRRPEEVCSLFNPLAEFRRTADGSTRFMQIYGHDMQIVASRVPDSAGRHAKTVMLFSDITQQKDSERHLQLYSEVFRHIGEGIMITNADNRIIEINDAVSRITGYPREELIGNTPSILKSGMHENSFYEGLWHTLRTTGYWKGEIFDCTRGGQIVPLLESISEVRDAEGKLTHHIAVITDISPIKETQRRLDFLANHDPLTDLPNRLLFNDRLQHAIKRARRGSLSVALLFIDLDHFKAVNDSHGHQVGDLLLVEIAKRLNALIRSADTLARLGGDEFVILMEALPSPLAAAQVADKIVASLKQPFNINGLSLHIGCSIGIALYPEDGEDATTMMKNADAAMYRAKEAGRDGYCRYSADLSAAKP